MKTKTSKEMVGFGSSDRCKRDFGLSNSVTAVMTQMIRKERKLLKPEITSLRSDFVSNIDSKLQNASKLKNDNPSVTSLGLDMSYDQGRNGPEFMFDVGR